MEHLNYTTNSNIKQSFRISHFNHLSIADRINIEKLLLLKNDKSYNGEKITIAYIAKIIGVNKSTISREIKRGTINPRKHTQKTRKVQKMMVKGDNISLRGAKANSREEFGHWEGDLIIGSKGISKSCLFTIIERKTRLYLSFKLENRQMKNVVSLLDSLENKIGKKEFSNIFKSITFDNGTEFRDFIGMEKSILGDGYRTKIYYANPYHSWERGSNENGNDTSIQIPYSSTLFE